MRKILLIFYILFFVGAIYADSLWNDESLYVDKKANKVGDIVTIIISENSVAKTSSGTDTSKDDTLSLSASNNTGELAFLPLFTSSAKGKHKYKGSGNTSRSGNIVATITARITDVLDNGNLLLEGHREILINGEKEIITITGIARPEDINSNNEIISTKIADAAISYRGKGTVSEGSRPGLLIRFLNWLF